MKRFFAIFMTMVMLLSFAACGNTTEVTNPTTTQNVTEQKQTFYESFFTKENYKTAGNSVKLSNPNVSISIIRDTDNVAMFEIKVLENFLRVYQLSDGKQYVNTQVAGEDGTVEDVWGQCESNMENMLESLDLDMTALDMDFDSITDVQYLKTQEDVDVIRVYRKDPDYVEGTVTKEYCIKFVYDDTDCEMIITTQIDPEGGEATDYNTEKVADGFDVFDYTVDYENKQLVHWEDESKNLPFELVSENTVTAGEDLSIDVYIDTKTNKVSYIKAMENEEEVLYEFFDVASCLEGVEIPSDAEPCDQEALAMMLLAVLFSGVEMQ